ncbi:MAG: hypothetical protein K8S23_17305 [Candidatus Cloacimonetes bacterium]|nr:hypothetical protein [Candidatus Cloacimonadota bacterium]
MVGSCLHASTWEIKQDGTGDFTAIQAGIDASVVGDTVLVYPGTYFENINFNGKDIIVGSLLLTTNEQNYMYNTIIDANHNGRVVTFENNETNDAVLIGFTIQHGFATDISGVYDGAGIFINFSSPSLKYLVIKKNTAKQGAGIQLSSSNAYLESVSIRQNHAFRLGGGILISRKPPNPINSYPIFSNENKCSIYNNTAGRASDIYIAENHTPVTNIVLDTLSVFNPGWDFVSQFPNINLEIEHDWLEQVEHDLYVAPNGDDDNSGLSENEPLQTIQWALTKIKADSMNHRNIYIAQGQYSPELTGEMFPLNMRAYVNIIGAGIDETIFTNPYDNSFFIRAYFDILFSVSNLTLQNSLNSRYEPFNSSYTNLQMKNLKFCNNEISNRIVYIAGGDEILINHLISNNNHSEMNLVIDLDTQIESNLTINNSIISGNEPTSNPDHVGAILGLYDIHYSKITNSLFFNNHTQSSDWPPCHFYFYNNGTIDFFNNTITNNTSNSGNACLFGIGVDDMEGEINIKNCNIYGNSIPYIFRTSSGDEPMNINISHSIIEGGTEPAILHMAGSGDYIPEFNFGEGIIDAPPLFVGGDWDDPLAYKLTENSPGVDAGTPDVSEMNLPMSDLLNNWRIWDGDGDGTSTIDIGCYEYDAPPYTSGINEDELPHFSLLSSNLMNYPNPFRISGNKRSCSTTFKFNVLKEGKVRLDVYNIKGQRVKNLYDVYTAPGDCEIMWNGLNDNGKPVASGLYLYKLESAGITEIKKLLILK